MRRLLPLLFVFCAGCIDDAIVVHLRPDGSGTIDVRHTLLKSFYAELSQQPPANDEEAVPPIDIERMFGARLRVTRTATSQTATAYTRTTTLAFDDITKVTLMFPPFVVDGRMGWSGNTSDDGFPLMHFALRDHGDGDRLLTLSVPHESFPKPGDGTPESSTVSSNEGDNGLTQRLSKGARLHLLVDVDAPVLRTNAPAREGNRMTVVSLDFEKMTASREFHERDVVMHPLSFEELRWAFDGVPGAVLPQDREITIEFLPPPPDAAPVQNPPSPPAQAPPPDTEIYLAPLTVRGDRVEIGAPRNISNSPGYDNQPSFTPDGAGILFTSVRGGGTQSDIYRYDVAGGRVVQITNTPESEYSPTVTPAGDVSVVRVEADRTQRLWQFTIDGGNPRVVLENVKPVGYHTWIDEHTLALFVLGEPATLQIADTRTGTARVVARNIGRSLRTIPGGRTIGFVQRLRTGDTVSLEIDALDAASGAVTELVQAPDGATEADCAW
ncbi:MAG: hypothetical protein DMF85_21230, partial [Acidobacteria bacterium]